MARLGIAIGVAAAAIASVAPAQELRVGFLTNFTGHRRSVRNRTDIDFRHEFTASVANGSARIFRK